MDTKLNLFYGRLKPLTYAVNLVNLIWVFLWQLNEDKLQKCVLDF